MKNIATVILLFVLCSVTVHAQWSLTGNSGTTPGTNFIGTTDAKDLVFKTNSIERGRILNASGTWRFGGSSNFVKIDSTGSMSFAGTAAYKVANNKYAFQAQANPNYGLFFNATSLQYEFRNASAAPMLSIGAATGNGIFTGTLKIGAYTLPATDGSNGQLLKTNGAGALTWQGDDNTVYTPGTGIDITGTTITNTAPDQTVSLTPGTGISVSGAYPSFTVSSTVPATQWTTSGSNIYFNTGNAGIGTATPLFKLDVAGDINQSAGSVLRVGDSAVFRYDGVHGNLWAGGVALSNTGVSNCAFGQGALFSNTSGSYNTASGNGALYSNTSASNNVAIGDDALYANSTGAANTASGALALLNNTTGSDNCASGALSLRSNTTGNFNTADGTFSLFSNITGSDNVASGTNALYINTTGSGNVANGSSALYVNYSGSNNTASGFNALTDNSTGNSNTAYGAYALFSITGVSNLVAVGDSSLYKNTTGTQNTAIGSKSLASNTSGSFNTATGYRSLFSNTTGYYNVANGTGVLLNNISGSDNVASGYHALYSNTTGNENVAAGQQALYANTTGSANVANGSATLQLNTTGSYNVAEGAEALENTTGSYNSGNGYRALLFNISGNSNTADGAFSLYNNFSGHSNVAIGISALNNNSTISNLVAVGDSAMMNNTTGAFNTALGSKSLFSNTIGGYNTANGYHALFSNTTGSTNTATGLQALSSNTTGSGNTASGYNSLDLNTSGSSNTASGSQALDLNTTGSRNTATGLNGLFNTTTGNNNTAVGFDALLSNSTGSHNSAIGDSANVSSGAFTNASALGSHAFVSASNSIVLGSISGVNGATSSVNVGIGTSNPSKKLYVLDGTSTGGTPNSNSSIVMEKNGISYFQILTPNASENGILFGLASNTISGGIIYNNGGTKEGFQFRTLNNINRMVIDSNGRVGIGTTIPAHKLQLSTDDAAKPGTGTWTIVSDARLKTNVEPFKDGIDVLNKINPVWFEYNGKAELPTNQKFVGVIAQEVQKAAPYMIGTHTYTDTTGRSTDYLDYNPNALFYILVNSVKQQQEQINTKDSAIESLQSENESQQAAIGTLQNENAALQSRLDKMDQQMQQFSQSLNDCCTKNQSSTIDGTAKITISNETIGALLGQNIPNPFDNSTLIPFRIPKGCSDASIVIAESATGRIVRVVPVSCSETQLTLEAGTLASGSYSYTLYVDGKQIATKQMVLVK